MTPREVTGFEGAIARAEAAQRRGCSPLEAMHARLTEARAVFFTAIAALADENSDIATALSVGNERAGEVLDDIELEQRYQRRRDEEVARVAAK